MKTIKTACFTMLIAAFITSCDSDEDNDVTTVCDAKFYTMAVDIPDSSVGVFDIFEYEKSNMLSTPMALTSGNALNNVTGGPLSEMLSAINPNTGEITYQFTYHPAIFKYNINSNTVTQSTFNGGYNYEYLGNSLYSIKHTYIGSSVLSDYTIIDASGNAVGQTIQNVDISNSGATTLLLFKSTSNNQDKLYYLANTKLLTYNKTTDTWSDDLLETYNETTNKVFYRSLEYVDDNTLYILKSDETIASSYTLELLKVDISGSVPQVSVIKDLTNSLSLSANTLLAPGGDRQINAAYDACDDSFYFNYTNPFTMNSIVFEIKLISDTVNEYPVNGKYLCGLDIIN